MTLLAATVEQHAGFEGELVDRIVDLFEIPFLQPGEQHRCADGALQAVGMPGPGLLESNTLHAFVLVCCGMSVLQGDCRNTTYQLADNGRRKVLSAGSFANMVVSHVGREAAGRSV